MIILTIRTDNPQAEIGLYSDDKQLDYVSWQAHRQLAETLHTKINEMLLRSARKWDNIEGVVAYTGPGSFTGLRIGITVANTIATGDSIAVVGANSEDWINAGISRLLKGEHQGNLTPEYGSPVHTTQPKK